MITIQRSVVAAAEIDRVYDYLADFANATEWDAGTVTCTLETGDGGIGSTYLNTSRFLGRETELVYTVQELQRNRLIVLQGENSTVTSTDYMLIQRVDAGTEVLYTAEFEFHGIAQVLQPALRIALVRLGDRAKESLETALARL